jgi:hypothetical protein
VVETKKFDVSRNRNFSPLFLEIDPCTGESEVVNVRLRHKTLKELHKDFLAETDIAMGFTSFKAMVRRRVRYPVHRTDMCDICEVGYVLESLAKGKRKLNPEEEQQLLAFREHQASAGVQRKAFNTLRETKDPKTCIINVDFKQNLKLPYLRDTPSRAFYSNQQISVLSYVVSYYDGSTYHEDVYTFLSECLKHDFVFLYDTLRTLLDLPIFTQFSKLHMFSDNAAVFRSSSWFGLFLSPHSDVAKRFDVTINYFNQHHGKGPNDRYFGVLSRYLLTASLSHDINTFKDLYQVLQNWTPTGTSERKVSYVVKRFLSLFSLLSLFILLYLMYFHYSSPY